MYPPFPGGQAQCKLPLVGLYGFCSLKAFWASLEDENKSGHALISSPCAERSWFPLFSKPSGIRGLHFCVYQTLQSPAVHACTDPPRRRRRVAAFLSFAGPPHDSCCLTKPRFEVYGNPPPLLPDPNRFPGSSAWELCWLRYPCFSCDPRDPETTLPHLGFCPTSPPEHLSGRDVSHLEQISKGLILHSGVMSLSCGRLTQAPSPCR